MKKFTKKHAVISSFICFIVVLIATSWRWDKNDTSWSDQEQLVISMENVVWRNYNELVLSLWEPDEYNDYQNQWIETTDDAYWNYWDRYMSASFQNKDEEIESFFLWNRKNDLNISLEDYSKFFSLYKLDNNQYEWQKAIKDPTKITWVNVYSN